MNYQTIKVRFQDPVFFLQINRPDANNTINDLLVEECRHALSVCETSATIVVLEGSAEVFCFGADFREMREQVSGGRVRGQNPEPLYDLWLRLSRGPYISVAHTRGKVNAGGVGFAAACDMVLADETAQFSLSELLFGLFPACVMPFLVRRVGFQRAHYLTLTTQPIAVQQAHAWGLVDAYGPQSEALLHRQLLRLRRLSKTAVAHYKDYVNGLQDILVRCKPEALAANHKVFADPVNVRGITRYVETGQFPWEA